jgi:hypothetical protein
VNDIVIKYVGKLVDELRAELRKNVEHELRSYFSQGDGARKVALRSSRKRRRILPCIAPGCKNPSKGPRFHYLCEEHMGAPKKDYEAWREKRKEKEARA